MRKSRFTETQIIGMIKEQEVGMPTVASKRFNVLERAAFCHSGELGDRPHISTYFVLTEPS